MNPVLTSMSIVDGKESKHRLLKSLYLVVLAAISTVPAQAGAAIVEAISAGGANGCALTSSGGVKCWGYNGTGSIGDGTTTNRSTPVDVSGLTSGVVAIALGGEHTCALMGSGGVKCWGNNFAGALGNGTTTSSNVAVNVIGLTSGVVAIAAGGAHTCALTNVGGVKCWGAGFHGELGNGGPPGSYSTSPVDVSGLASGVIGISVGNTHTCALTTSNGMKCWGYNGTGAIGDGTTTDRSTPVDVSGLTSGVVAIDAGWEYTCAVTSGGGAKCWGTNYAGQLGDGMLTEADTPVDVSGLTSGVAAIETGDTHTCVLTTGGGVKCWGRNQYGQLGDGTTNSSPTAVDVSGLASGITAIAVGNFFGYHTCALTSAGGVKCWGNNDYGQLGNGTPGTQSLVPSDVINLDCGNGGIDPGETCDDGNTADGDGCSASCQIQATPTPTQTPLATVTPTLTPTPSPTATPFCGDGVQAAGEECDDNNVAPDDGCSPTCTLEPCVAAPVQGCLDATQASLKSDERKIGKERLTLKWKKVMNATSQSAFGDPVSGTTRVALCLYDDDGALIRGFVVDRAGQSCAGRLCWVAKTGTQGYAYKDKAASADGVVTIGYASGVSGKGKVGARGANDISKGQNALPHGVAAALSGNIHPTMQVVTSDGFCLGATIAEVIKDDGALYKARRK